MPFWRINNTKLTLPAIANIPLADAIGTFPAATYINIHFYSHVVIKSTFNDNIATCAVRLNFYDSNNNYIVISDLQSITNSAILESGRYIGSTISFDNREYGASKMKIQITALSTNDTVSFYVAGIPKNNIYN